MLTEDAIARFRLVCEAEALARGFEAEVGHDVMLKGMGAVIEDWDEETIYRELWRTRMVYGLSSDKSRELIELFIDCEQIFQDYHPLFNAAEGSGAGGWRG